MPAVLRRRGTHGSLYDRIIAAGATPEFKRPAAPSQIRTYGAVAVSAALAVLLFISLERFPNRSPIDRHMTETAIMWRLAIGAGGARELAELAEIRDRAGLTEQAAAFYGAAAELDSFSVIYPAKLASTLSALGRCEEAEEASSVAKNNLDDGCDCHEMGEEFAERAAEDAVKHCKPGHAL